jgi:dTDP-4-amino-4,6-dideoxygalactose transaminase
MIPLTRPHFGPEETRAATAAIESGWVSQGAKVEAFERAVAGFCGTREAVAVSSCTAALHLSLLALQIGPGDQVVCPSMSFIATANTIRYAGATPVFADVDPRTFNLDPDSAEAALTNRTKAIMVVHQIGLPADLDRFNAIGAKHNVKILEDAAPALGSRYRNEPIGGHSEMACFSFHARKIITTGEGGMITTNNAGYARQLRLLRHHGMSVPDTVRHESKRVLTERYECLGYNYRMSDVHAAIGLEQVKKLPAILRRRCALAGRYDEALRTHPRLELPHVPAFAEPNFQSYAVRLKDDAPWTVDDLRQQLRDQGIATGRGVMLAHEEAPYRGAPVPLTLERSENASRRSFLLPLYPDLTFSDQDRVIDALVRANRHG